MINYISESKSQIATSKNILFDLVESYTIMERGENRRLFHSRRCILLDLIILHFVTGTVGTFFYFYGIFMEYLDINMPTGIFPVKRRLRASKVYIILSTIKCLLPTTCFSEGSFFIGYVYSGLL